MLWFTQLTSQHALHYRQSRGLSEQLKARDVRPTPQREVVLKVILEKRDHPTADEIFARVKASMPTISLASVYNCLDALVQGGLVRSVNFERGPTRYCPNLHPHAHFHDEATGATHDIELPAELLTQVKTILPAGYDASTVEIIFRGKAAAN
ncbi:MAG: transcriptional repressor [Lacunisphaera sp.]|nr:transcriptional repressor [Lacunisphaera sp.]